MAYFHNRTVNLLNLHYTIGTVALSGGGAFYAVYLLKAGVSVPGALLAMAATFMLRLLIRSFLLPFAIRYGLKRLVIAGAILMGLSFPVLGFVHGVGIGLLCVVLAGAFADTVYWPSYHAYFAALGDEDHRGQQLGLREAVAAAVGILSPLAAGWLLIAFGPWAAFGATGAVMAASAVPLLWTPDVPVKAQAPGAFRAALSGAMLFVGDGWIAAASFITWQITLFLALGENIMAYGGALAVAALVGAVGGLVLGRFIDSGQGARAVWLAMGLEALQIVMRAFVWHSPALAVVAMAFGSLVGCLYIPTMMTAVYNQAKRSPCVMRFHIAAEGGWDVGVTTGLAIVAALVWLGVPIGYTILIALVGAAFVFALLQRYYAAHPSEVVDTSLELTELAGHAGEIPKM